MFKPTVILPDAHKNNRAQKIRRDRYHNEMDRFSDGIRVKRVGKDRPRPRHWSPEDEE